MKKHKEEITFVLQVIGLGLLALLVAWGQQK